MQNESWIRKASLIASGEGDGIDLSEMHFTFKTRQADIQTPNSLLVRIYNLSRETTSRFTSTPEFKRVTLQAGYQHGAFGVLFDGSIVQCRQGREDPTTSFLEILAADADYGLNFAVVNSSLEAGSKPADRLVVALHALSSHGISRGHVADLPAEALPRGRVLFGMARDLVRRIAASAGMTYSVQDGRLQLLPLSGFLPGEAVEMTSATGMIGWPEQTESGIRLRSLINPAVRVGCKLRINNASVLQALGGVSVEAETAFENLKAQVSLNNDGVYRVYVIEHSGDTRGQDWFSDIICLDVNGTIPDALAASGRA